MVPGGECQATAIGRKSGEAEEVGARGDHSVIGPALVGAERDQAILGLVSRSALLLHGDQPTRISGKIEVRVARARRELVDCPDVTSCHQ